MNYIHVYGVILYIKNNKPGIAVFMNTCINNFQNIISLFKDE